MAGSLLERQLWAKPVAIRRVRRLEVDGRVLVGEGQTVRADEPVVRGQLTPAPLLVPVARLLGLADPAIDRYLKRKPGEQVRKGEVIAQIRGLLGLRSRSCQSMVDGTLEAGPAGSGVLFVVPAAREVEVLAHFPGTVVSVLHPRAVVLEFTAVGMQGIVGCGGEGGGPVRVLAGPRGQISASRISSAFARSVIVGGSTDLAGLRQAATVGVAGMIVGSLSGAAFEAFAAEGHEMPLVVTDGFGAGGMAQPCFDLLQEHETREARVSGGGDEAPEVFVPVDAPAAPRARPPVLGLGALVRVAAGPAALKVGRVVGIGGAPARLPSGLVGRWIDVQLGADDGQPLRVPATNVELMSS